MNEIAWVTIRMAEKEEKKKRGGRRTKRRRRSETALKIRTPRKNMGKK